MAAYVRNGGNTTTKTNGSSISQSVAGVGHSAGNLLVVNLAFDNLSATTPTATFSDSKGNTYTTISQSATNASASAGVGGAIGVSYLSTALASGDTVTATLSSAVDAKVITIAEFSGTLDVEEVADVIATGASTTPSVTSGSAPSGDVVIGSVMAELDNSAGVDSDTTNGSWVTMAQAWTFGGNQFSNVSVRSQYKIVTASGTQTFNPTLPTSTDWVALVVVLASGAKRTATSSGTGSSSASGSKVTGPQTVSRTATGSGTGSSSATRLVTDLRTASASGTGSSTDARVVTRLRTASSSGTGGSLAAGAKAVLRSATAAGSGTSTATSTFTRSRTASASGTGTSTASRAVIRARTATSSGVGLFDSTGLVIRIRTAAASGVGSGTAAPVRKVTAAASAAGVGVSVVVSLKTAFRTGTSAGFSASSAQSERIFELFVPLRPREMRKKFFPPPSKPVGKGKPLQPPRVRW